MENPVRSAEGERPSLSAVPRSEGETTPILLSLPARSGDASSAQHAEDSEAALEQLLLIETGSSPRVEMAFLADLLTRSPGLAQGLADPHEVHGYQHPLASVNVYKHRIHALRCEFVNTRLRTVELEEQSAKARERIQRLENHVRFLEDTLSQMRQSRAWLWAERCSRWHRALTGWLRERRAAA